MEIKSYMLTIFLLPKIKKAFIDIASEGNKKSFAR